MMKKSSWLLLLLSVAVTMMYFILQSNWLLQATAEQTTVLIDVVPTAPATTVTGICWARSEVVALANAWRCGVDDGPERGTVYDPCFSQSDGRHVICGVDPATGTPGLLLTLRDTLLIPLLDQQTPQLWQIELADGAVCTILAGPTLSFDNQPLRYSCDDGAFVLGDLESRVSWHAEKVRIERRKGGYGIVKQENIPVRTVWRAALPPTLTTISTIALLDGIYQINDEQVKLRAGQFDTKAESSGFSRTIYRLKFAEDSLWRSDGDLNGDGSRDAVVLLTEETGGSGFYTYLAVMLNFDGVPLNVATFFLGDRIMVHDLLIEEGEVEVRLTIQGAGDALCCATQTEQLRYALVDHQLVERGRRVLLPSIQKRLTAFSYQPTWATTTITLTDGIYAGHLTVDGQPVQAEVSILRQVSAPDIPLFTYGNLNEDQWEEAAIILHAQLSDGTTHLDLVILQMLDDQLRPVANASLPSPHTIDDLYITEGEVVVRYSADSAARLEDRYRLVNGHLQQK